MCEIVMELITNGFSGTRVDNSMDLKLNVREDQLAEAMQSFSRKGLKVYLALGSLEEPSQGAEYGEFAKALRLSKFFFYPKVWDKIGSDEEFLTFIRTQNCAYCGQTENIEAAHVRRIAEGAGIGIKPTYCAIPLCRHCHLQQHQHGESALNGKEWFDTTRIEYVVKWCWETLKHTLGYESWRQVPPCEFYAWVINNDLEDCLTKYFLESIKKTGE